MGTKKYSEHNWLKGMNWSRMIAAAMRHLEAFRGGEDFDPESGLPHLSHATWNLVALTEYWLSGIGEDDRIDQLEGLKYCEIMQRIVGGPYLPVDTEPPRDVVDHGSIIEKQYDSEADFKKAMTQHQRGD